jgi:hypothetical protein
VSPDAGAHDIGHRGRHGRVLEGEYLGDQKRVAAGELVETAGPSRLRELTDGLGRESRQRHASCRAVRGEPTHHVREQVVTGLVVPVGHQDEGRQR